VSLRQRLADPFGFPRYHAAAFKQLTRWIYQGLRHPKPATFQGLMIPGSLAHAVWWTFSDLGWSPAWRPYCWARRYHSPHHCDVHFEMCTVCGISLWSRSRDGSPNPYRGADRAPIRRNGVRP
jgi:hypothetical protein